MRWKRLSTGEDATIPIPGSERVEGLRAEAQRWRVSVPEEERGSEGPGMRMAMRRIETCEYLADHLLWREGQGPKPTPPRRDVVDLMIGEVEASGAAWVTEIGKEIASDVPGSAAPTP